MASQLLHVFAFGAGPAEAANMAISAVLLAALVTSAFVGTALIRADIERGTLALMLCQPVRVADYVAGRFLGLVSVTLLVCVLTAAGVTASLLLAGAPDGFLSGSLLMGWGRVTLAALVLSGAALAVSAPLGRYFAPVLLLAIFLSGDVAGPTLLGRLLPAFGLFGLDVDRAPSPPWLLLYAMLYSVVFLGTTYLQLTLRPPIRTES
jgi:ABC-type Na+ efflux pump permease subunit